MKILQLAIGLPITVCQIATKAANLVARFFFSLSERTKCLLLEHEALYSKESIYM